MNNFIRAMMKVLQVLVFGFVASFCFVNALGQEKSKDIIINGTVKIEIEKVVPITNKLKKINPFGKAKNNQNINSTNVKKLVESNSSSDENFEFKIIQKAVVRFTSNKGIVYSAKTDEKGQYQINLPVGKYTIYATASESCWMCAEYYNNNFLVENRDKIKLNIILRFFGEG